MEDNGSVLSHIPLFEAYKSGWGFVRRTQPISNAIILISNLFSAQAPKEIYGFAVHLALLSPDTAAQQNFRSYSQMAAERFRRLPFQPPLRLLLISTLKSYFRRNAGCLPHIVCVCVYRSPRSGSATRFAPRRHRKARYRYFFFFLLKSKSNGAVAAGVTRQKKRTLPCT